MSRTPADAVDIPPVTLKYRATRAAGYVPHTYGAIPRGTGHEIARRRRGAVPYSGRMSSKSVNKPSVGEGKYAQCRITACQQRRTLQFNDSPRTAHSEVGRDSIDAFNIGLVSTDQQPERIRQYKRLVVAQKRRQRHSACCSGRRSRLLNLPAGRLTKKHLQSIRRDIRLRPHHRRFLHQLPPHPHQALSLPLHALPIPERRRIMDRRRRREVGEVVEVVRVGLVVLERLEALGQEVEGFLRFAVLDVFEELLAVTHVQEGALGLRAETAGAYESFEDAVLAIWDLSTGPRSACVERLTQQPPLHLAHNVCLRRTRRS